jgi:SAM-dependent methyltransferase
MNLTYRGTCRLCGSAALTPAIDLGPQYLQGAFVKPDRPPPPLDRIPTELVRCDRSRDPGACGLLQTRVTVPGELLYREYWYRSSTNRTMRDHLRGIAEQAVAHVGADIRALDIGCNDGTLLKSYPASVTRVGIDPSDAARGVEGDLVVINDFFPSPALRPLAGEAGFDAITSIAMIYDLDDPVGFVRALADLLATDGVWLFEMSYLPTMLAQNSYDTICHEHIEYYSLAVVETLLARAGLKVVDVSFNGINGGSIRCTAAHAACTRHDSDEALARVGSVRRSEAELGLDTDAPYVDFQRRIERCREDLNALVRGLVAQGKRVHLYGASTKGNTILQWCGLDHSLIEAASDRNPQKDGARTLGTDIPILSEEASRAMKPDAYLVLPWHFRAEFLEREAAARAQGVQFIFPLPDIEIV